MSAMPAESHSALELQALGFSVIPLAPNDKRPYGHILPTGWRDYQRRCADASQVQQWINLGDQHMGWGVVCGTVSGSAYCLDCDDLDFAHWVLEHSGEALFHGALIVESGSGKAHVWIRSQTPMRSSVWSLGQGRKAGDIRGEGSGGAGPSYMVVPPSLHPDTGRPYRIRSGSFAALPWLPDGAKLAQEIVAAYLADGAGSGVSNGTVGTPSAASHRVLQLDDAQVAVVVSRVRMLRLKKRIEQSILQPGVGAPGSPAWSLSTDSSGSGIDFAVVCELIRRDQTLEEVEEIFAACPIGDNCYRAKGRGSYGFNYIRLTYGKAKTSVEAELQASRVATGTNFVVKEVVCRERGDLSEFRLRIEVTRPGRQTTESVVDITSTEMETEQGFRKACFKPASGRWIPEFLPAQRGQGWPRFMQAVSDMASETQKVPVEYTDEGAMARRLEALINSLRDETEAPTRFAWVAGLGWKFDGAFYLFPEYVLGRAQNVDRRMDSTRLSKVLGIIGHVDYFTYAGWVDHLPTPVYKITPR